MLPADIIEHIIPGALWVLGPCFLGLVAAILVGVLLAQRKKVPGPVGALVIVTPVCWSLLVGTWLLSGAANTEFEVALTSIAAVLGARFVMMFCAPGIAATLGLFTAFAGARGSDRSVVIAVLVGLAALWGAGIPLVYAVQQSDWAHPVLRAVMYLLLGTLTAVAALSSEREQGAGTQAASMAGVSFAWAVASVEAALLAMAYVLMIQAAPAPEHSAAYVQSTVAGTIGSLRGWSWGVVGLAVVAGGIAQVPSFRSGRVGAGVVGVLLCVAALGVVGLGFPSEVLLFELLSGR